MLVVAVTNYCCYRFYSILFKFFIMATLRNLNFASASNHTSNQPEWQSFCYKPDQCTLFSTSFSASNDQSIFNLFTQAAVCCFVVPPIAIKFHSVFPLKIMPKCKQTAEWKFHPPTFCAVNRFIFVVPTGNYNKIPVESWTSEHTCWFFKLTPLEGEVNAWINRESFELKQLINYETARTCQLTLDSIL